MRLEVKNRQTLNRLVRAWLGIVAPGIMLSACSDDGTQGTGVTGDADITVRGLPTSETLSVRGMINCPSMSLPRGFSLSRGEKDWGTGLRAIPADTGCEVTIIASDASFQEIFSAKVDGLSIVASRAASIVLTAHQNSPAGKSSGAVPRIDALAISSTTPAPAEAVALRVVAHTPNSDRPLRYEWSADGGGFANSSESATTWTAPEIDGTYHLRVRVSDPNGAANAAFSQAVQVTKGLSWFTVVAVPDTQYYSKNSPLTPIFRAQIDWIMANRATRNIAFVAHEGDIVDTGTSTSQWANAMSALSPLIAPTSTLPFALNRGNHDDPSYYVRNVGPQIYENRTWHVVVSPNGLNTASIFQAAGRSFAHIGLNKDPSVDELTWVNQVLSRKEFVDLPTILTTHDYLMWGFRSLTGTAIWNGVVKKNPQIFMVLNGHTHGEYQMVSNNEEGKPVYQMLADYQNRTDGGQGLMRLIQVDTAAGRIDVKTFSPGYTILEGRGSKTIAPFFETDHDSQFSYDVDLEERFKLASKDGALSSQAPPRTKGVTRY